MDREAPLFQKLLDTRLPLAPRLGEICAALEERGTVILRADPGSGKSTLLPLALMEWGERGGGEGAGKIVMLEGRRAAAQAAAVRMAELLGEEPGERVGYAVRMERKISPRTRIEVLTEGLLVRRLQGGPELRGVSTVIFDEFHERSVHTDLALTLTLDLRRMGSPVKILLMSATLDAFSLVSFFGALEDPAGTGRREAALIDCPGRIFPVDISYRPLPEKDRLGQECGRALGSILREEAPPLKPGGDILAFLPGKREIAEAAAVLGELSGAPAGGAGEFEIFSLHGGLPLSRQREIIAPVKRDEGKRRVILSTNVAETALTIPGIGLVVDSGYTRLERYHLSAGMNRLVTEFESKSSAEQRAGRAGRLARGRCIRLWAEGERQLRETESEIRRTDLSALILECLIWGVRKPEELPWLESPSAAAWSAGLELLQSLGAADREFNPTPAGREMARLGLEVRLACLCLAGKDSPRFSPSLACAAAAALSGRDGSGVSGDGDFRRRLALLRRFGEDPRGLSAEERAWAAGVRETAADLLARLFPAAPPPRGIFSWAVEEEADAGELLAAAFPDRIGQRQERGRFRFPGGREARIEGSLENAEWIAAAEADAGERLGFVRLAAPLSKEEALAALRGRMERETGIVWKGLVPRSVVTLRAGRLVLGEERNKCRREEAARDLPRFLGAEGISILPWDGGTEPPGLRETPRRLLERIRFFAAAPGKPAGGTDWTDAVLAAEAEEWLGPFLWEGGREGEGPILDGGALIRALETRFGWQGKRELDARVPAWFSLPKGKKRPLDYASGEPVLRIRLQDAFGITGETGILSVPITFELLSPAGRPVQITRDLPGFWTGSYAAVRREMRGRYPKHFWPEDPQGVP